ncbi:MAG TPA: hypothetical protein VJG32_08155 [Anaerolineae bacterium]|nr:hypothetical protein [Anaerolineae bacterium]
MARKLPGKKVLVAPQWIATISWLEKRVSVDLTRRTIKNSPEYDSTAPLEPNYEEKLHTPYGRPQP